MKKILFFNHVNRISGASVSFFNIVRAIDKSKYEVEVVTPDNDKFISNQMHKLGIKVHYYSGSISIAHYNGANNCVLSPWLWMNRIRVFFNKKKIRKIIEESDCSIVMVNSMTMFYLGKIIKQYNKKAICFHRETFPAGLRSKIIARQMEKYFDKIVCISEYDVKSFNASKKIELIYDKVDIEKFEQAASMREEIRRKEKLCGKCILFLGGLNRIKDTLTAIKAVRKLSGCLLIICGTDGKKDKVKLKNLSGFKSKIRYLFGKHYEAKCINYIAKHNMWDKIRLYGYMPDIEKMYAACDIVLFCAEKAHQARPIYEASVCRKKIVVPDFKNFQEFSFENVLKYRCKSAESLAGVLQSSLQDDEKSFFEKVEINDIKKRFGLQGLKEEIGFLLDEVSK